jgi:hypothetical protein
MGSASEELMVCRLFAGGEADPNPRSQLGDGSRESVNKHLQAWHKAGWIDLDKGTIVIRNLTAIDGS